MLVFFLLTVGRLLVGLRVGLGLESHITVSYYHIIIIIIEFKHILYTLANIPRVAWDINACPQEVVWVSMTQTISLPKSSCVCMLSVICRVKLCLHAEVIGL